jgi:hypothetical protein
VSTAGHSGTPLPRKLGIREGCRLLLAGAPVGFDAVLGDLPAGVELVSQPAGRSTWRFSSRST